MKKTALLALLAGILYSCSGNSSQETGADTAQTQDEAKQLFSRVIAVHDEVMTYERMILENRAKLDSIAKLDLPSPVKDSAILLSKNLTVAENAMSDWMHKFEPDYSAKSKGEAIKYLTAEESKIKKVDTLTKNAIRASWEFYTKYKK
ncbi:hypothetical protein DJ568_08605 [Mucilaginibacter hurinus]|uniref:Viral A-type inclusion protein n=1 Tax=Mucilaginibacter hurinus TaxID=2201324 RepID=A0A367GQ84_9SPHI|nr:hypothetical protein [Mucilaginibacter hurinus]RCH55238.1 hypothetical protein DJ568_08605 [Mucilaginibacter hurinus]